MARKTSKHNYTAILRKHNTLLGYTLKGPLATREEKTQALHRKMNETVNFPGDNGTLERFSRKAWLIYLILTGWEVHASDLGGSAFRLKKNNEVIKLSKDERRFTRYLIDTLDIRKNIRRVIYELEREKEVSIAKERQILLDEKFQDNYERNAYVYCMQLKRNGDERILGLRLILSYYEKTATDDDINFLYYVDNYSTQFCQEQIYQLISKDPRVYGKCFEYCTGIKVPAVKSKYTRLLGVVKKYMFKPPVPLKDIRSKILHAK